MVQKVERLGSKLQRQTLAQPRVLHQRHVHVEVAGSAQDVSSGIAKRALLRKVKRPGVEPAIRGWMIEPWVELEIGTIVSSKPERRPAGMADVEFREQRDRERRSRLRGHDSKRLPTGKRR